MKYSLEQIDQIMAEVCGRIAAGQTLRNICGWIEEENQQTKKITRRKRNPHLPSAGTIIAWVYSEKEELKFILERYERARVAQADAWAEEIIDEGRNATPETAHAARVRIDALRWGASKANSGRYGDRQHISMDAKIERTKGEDKAPEWMQEKLAETPGEAVGAALDAAVQGKPKGATTH